MQFALREYGNEARFEQALRFYQEVFGLKIVREEGKLVELISGNCRLTLYRGEASELTTESEASFPLPTSDIESFSHRWYRDPFGFAFRWSLARDKSPDALCYR
jgi:catechol 2,3-dioxygenase-like lactoylglutathione lyase family enzyme